MRTAVDGLLGTDRWRRGRNIQHRILILLILSGSFAGCWFWYNRLGWFWYNRLSRIRGCCHLNISRCFFDWSSSGCSSSWPLASIWPSGCGTSLELPLLNPGTFFMGLRIPGSVCNSAASTNSWSWSPLAGPGGSPSAGSAGLAWACPFGHPAAVAHSTRVLVPWSKVGTNTCDAPRLKQGKVKQQTC